MFRTYLRVWITIDNKIIFWNYQSPNDVDRYDGLNEIIVSVALSAPKPGVFLDSVKYLLIISTTVEVVIMAISWSASGTDLKIIPTAYTVSSDNIPMVKVIGTQSGRVFMGGQDGNLYELDYTNVDNKWASMLGLDGVTHKCQKVNHNGWTLKAILPPFIRSILLAEESVTDLVVDDIRHLLYVVSSLNHLRVLHLGADNKATHYLVHDFDLLAEIKSFISSRGRGYDTIPRIDCFQDASSAKVVNSFVVTATESRGVHLVVVLQSGIRVYLQLLTWTDMRRSFAPYVQGLFNQPRLGDSRLHIVFIRGLPTADTLNDCKNPPAALPTDGYLPQIVPSRADHSKISMSYYSNGAFLAGWTSRDSLVPDELVGLGEDLVARRSGPAPAVITYYEQPVPTARESVCRVSSWQGGSVMNYKIFDIRESCPWLQAPAQAALWALALTSGTPVVNEIKDESHLKPLSALKPQLKSSNPSSFFSSAISAAGQPSSLGIPATHVDYLTNMSEFLIQSLPISTQRQFLCLTRFGLLVVRKNRPIDYLTKALVASADGNLDNAAYREGVEEVFKSYGHTETLSMCLEIICGLTGSDTPQNNVLFPNYDSKVLRERARRAISRFGGAAGFETSGRGASFDRGVVDNRLTAGSIAPNYHFSFTHDALQLCMSRFLRTLWLRPVTENKALSPLWGQSSILATVGSVLEAFKGVIPELYPAAIKAELYVAPKKDQLDASLVDTSYTTQGNLLMDHIAAQRGPVVVDPMKEFQREAERREHASVNGYWRLLSRACQAVTLVQVLTVLETVHKIKVKWVELGDVSFRTLVISSRVHIKVKKLIHGLIAQMTRPAVSTTAVLTAPSAADHRLLGVADDFAQKLSADCFSYFSAGDRYAYEVSRQVEVIRADIQSNPAGVPRAVLQARTDDFVSKLFKASKFWIGLEDVTSTPVTQSLLESYCHLLNQLGDLGKLGIVKICLSTARNFHCDKAPRGPALSSDDFRSLDSRADLSRAHLLENGAGIVEWDRSLYHVGANLTDAQKQDGQMACYRCLLLFVEETIRAFKLSGTSDTSGYLVSEGSVGAMVDDILQSCADCALRTLLYELLLRELPSQLLRIQASDLEEYLLSVDPDHKYEFLYK